MDVSKAVDLLIRGAAPERSAELAELWGDGPDRAHLTDAPYFDIHEVFGVVQTTEITIREIWLLSFAAWRAIEAYSGILYLLKCNNMPFNRDEVATSHGQADADAAFDTVLCKAKELREVGDLDAFQWPRDVPEPQENNAFQNQQDKAAFDLACIAGAYIFLHEIQHVNLGKGDNRPADPRDEELECDAYARRFLLDKIDEYAKQSGDSSDGVRAKRALGIAVGKTIILEVTPQQQWHGTDSHPPVGVRVRTFLDDLPKTIPETFWISMASFLAAICRSRNCLPQEIRFSSFRELAFALAYCL